MEIERRWLVEGWPALTPSAVLQMDQGYFAVRPAIRIRREAVLGGETRYVLCFKGDGTLAREEIELPLDVDTYERLRGLLKAPLVHKTYKVYPLPDGRRLEVSLVDEGEPQAFYYAEVEFDSVEEANAFVPPAFLGADVTENPAFSMSVYWETRQKPAIE